MLGVARGQPIQLITADQAHKDPPNSKGSSGAPLATTCTTMSDVCATCGAIGQGHTSILRKGTLAFEMTTCGVCRESTKRQVPPAKYRKLKDLAAPGGGASGGSALSAPPLPSSSRAQLAVTYVEVCAPPSAFQRCLLSRALQGLVTDSGGRLVYRESDPPADHHLAVARLEGAYPAGAPIIRVSLPESDEGPPILIVIDHEGRYYLVEGPFAHAYASATTSPDGNLTFHLDEITGVGASSATTGAVNAWCKTYPTLSGPYSKNPPPPGPPDPVQQCLVGTVPMGPLLRPFTGGEGGAPACRCGALCTRARSTKEGTDNYGRFYDMCPFEHTTTSAEGGAAQFRTSCGHFEWGPDDFANTLDPEPPSDTTIKVGAHMFADVATATDHAFDVTTGRLTGPKGYVRRVVFGRVADPDTFILAARPSYGEHDDIDRYRVLLETDNDLYILPVDGLPPPRKGALAEVTLRTLVQRSSMSVAKY